MFYNGVNPKTTDGLKQWKNKKKEDTPQIKQVSYFLVFKYSYT